MNLAAEISSVSKFYGSFRLQDVNLAVPAGNILGLIGQNGAGKTTLFKCILNLIGRDSGSVRMPGIGQDISSEKIRGLVGYVPERLAFYEWMTVDAALRFTSKFYPNWDAGRCRDLMSRYELDSGKKIKELSMGMRKKLGLLQALAIQPRLLILDEPTSGLDPVMKFYFLQDLRHVIDTGATGAVMISSHNLDEVERLVDSIAILKLGVLRCHEPKRRFLEAWHKVEFTPPAEVDWVREFENTAHPIAANRAMFVTREETGYLTRKLALLGAGAIEVSRPNLQEIFLQVA
ncbi:MAG: ABC transporter ATP-binding protein [Acidobacteriia bacterium]|nr:ABC transporter ATP-binding protein [Terriglobia bacterium]